MVINLWLEARLWDLNTLTTLNNSYEMKIFVLPGTVLSIMLEVTFSLLLPIKGLIVGPWKYIFCGRNFKKPVIWWRQYVFYVLSLFIFSIDKNVEFEIFELHTRFRILITIFNWRKLSLELTLLVRFQIFQLLRKFIGKFQLPVKSCN